jgi:predicted aspartyl protease
LRHDAASRTVAAEASHGNDRCPCAYRQPRRPRRSAEVDLVVDSGAIYSVIPAAVLRTIGVEPRKVETFSLANGGTVRRAIGDVYYEIDRSAGAAPVIFGRRGDTSLLGVVTLEALGYGSIRFGARFARCG